MAVGGFDPDAGRPAAVHTRFGHHEPSRVGRNGPGVEGAAEDRFEWPVQVPPGIRVGGQVGENQREKFLMGAFFKRAAFVARGKHRTAALCSVEAHAQIERRGRHSGCADCVPGASQTATALVNPCGSLPRCGFQTCLPSVHASCPGLPRHKGQAPAELAGGNIDKVRDIIFGGQMRDYERRFARLEERFLQETTELKDDVRRRLTALEQFVKDETASLAERITTEQAARADETKDLARDWRESARVIEKKSAQLDDQIGRVQRELRQQILELHQNVGDELRHRIDEVLARLGRESTELRNDKADRATIAALLSEMAMRLTNELSIPGMDRDPNG